MVEWAQLAVAAVLVVIGVFIVLIDRRLRRAEQHLAAIEAALQPRETRVVEGAVRAVEGLAMRAPRRSGINGGPT